MQSVLHVAVIFKFSAFAICVAIEPTPPDAPRMHKRLPCPPPNKIIMRELSHFVIFNLKKFKKNGMQTLWCQCTENTSNVTGYVQSGPSGEASIQNSSRLNIVNCFWFMWYLENILHINKNVGARILIQSDSHLILTHVSSTTTYSAWQPDRCGGTTPQTLSPICISSRTDIPFLVTTPQKSRPNVNGNSMFVLHRIIFNSVEP